MDWAELTHKSPTFEILELSRAVRDPRARQSTKYNTLIPHAARDVLAVEVLQ